MNTSSNDEFKSLLASALEGKLSPQELEKFQSSLKSDPALRQMYIDHALLDAHLADEFNTDSIRGMVDMIAANSPNHKVKKSIFTSKSWNLIRFGGIAASIILAVLMTSATIAYALPFNGPRIIHLNSFNNAGFETPSPIEEGFPRVVGRWSGDSSTINQLGARAREGMHALSFDAAKGNENAVSSPANFCDVFQIIDLRPFHPITAEKEALLEFSIDFLDARESGEPLWHMTKIYLFEGDPNTIHENWPANLTECVGSGMDHFSSTGFGRPEWKTVTSRCVIPRMATFAVLQIAVGNLPHERKSPSPALNKQYADNARLSLVVRPQTNAR